MESQSQKKYVLISYLLFVAVITFVVFSAATKISGYMDLETKVKSLEMVLSLGSVAFGALLLLFLVRSDTVNQFMHEVVAEVSRVSWPTQEETLKTLWWVLGLVVVTGIFLALIDRFWTLVIQWIL